MNMTEREIAECKRVEVKFPYSFILGGDACFSILNSNSGTKFDYRVKKAEKGSNFFIYTPIDGVLSYVGYLVKYNGGLFYRRGDKGKLEEGSPQIRGLLYALKFNNTLPMPMIMIHHGKCAKCGRKLKDAESVARGFGPDCWKKVMG